MSGEPVGWEIFSDSDAVVEALVERISAAAMRAIAEHHAFRLVLAGGTTPRQLYQRLTGTVQDWAHWWLLLGDERCLPVTDPGRNSRMALEAGFAAVGIPQAQQLFMPAELGPVAASQRYAQTIAPHLPFDLVLLGAGEDGHAASLFPGYPWDERALVVPVFGAPKPPPERLSLGPASLLGARQRLFIITGASKAPMVQRWRAGADLPVARLQLSNDTVLLDAAAAGCS